MPFYFKLSFPFASKLTSELIEKQCILLMKNTRSTVLLGIKKVVTFNTF